MFKIGAKKSGQMSTIATFFTAGATIIASFIASFATSENKISQVQNNVSIIEERENNHYAEVKEHLERIEKKLDQITTQTTKIK